MASGQTFESDLRALREARGLSLTEIHQQTRIPVDVLRRFEDGDLVQDPTYNEVYLKAFIQSYAKAIGAPASAVLVAYEDQKAGAYRGALHPDDSAGAPAEAPADPPRPSSAGERDAEDAPAPVPETAKAPKPPATPPADRPSDARKPQARTPDARTPEARTPDARPPASASPPAVAALRQAPDPETKRDTQPKTLAEARVNRPAVPTADRSFDKNWTTILGLFVVVLVLIGGALYVLVFAGDDGPEAADETVAVGAEGTEATETAGPPPREGAETGGPELQLPISVTVTAGGDGLQWFRVTQDAGERLPHWIDLGVSQTFQADSALVFWGEGNDAAPAYAFDESTLEIQGLRFTPPNGRELVLTPQTAQRLLDSLATATPTP